MSIKLINHNYELIVASFENQIYVKITNLITWYTFESNIYSYDIINEYVRTIENLFNVFCKCFKFMDKFKIDILNPNIKTFNNNDDYIVLKLLEQHDNIILTIYYNLTIRFEFNIELKKIQNSDCKNKVITQLQIKLNNKDIQLNELQNKINVQNDDYNKLQNSLNESQFKLDKLQNRLDELQNNSNEENIDPINVVDVAIGKYNWKKIVYCKSNIEILDVSSITLNTKLTELYKLKRLIFRGDEEITNSTLEELIIYGHQRWSSSGYRPYYFYIPNLSGILRLKRLEFNKCHHIDTYDYKKCHHIDTYDYNHSISCLIHSIKHHPNCSNIDLVFSDNYNEASPGGRIINGIFVSEYEKFLNLGLKSVTIY